MSASRAWSETATQSAIRPLSSWSLRGSAAWPTSSKNGTTIGPFWPAGALWMWPRFGAPVSLKLLISKQTWPPFTSTWIVAFADPSGSADGTSFVPASRAVRTTVSSAAATLPADTSPITRASIVNQAKRVRIGILPWGCGHEPRYGTYARRPSADCVTPRVLQIFDHIRILLRIVTRSHWG